MIRKFRLVLLDEERAMVDATTFSIPVNNGRVPPKDELSELLAEHARDLAVQLQKDLHSPF